MAKWIPSQAATRDPPHTGTKEAAYRKEDKLRDNNQQGEEAPRIAPCLPAAAGRDAATKDPQTDGARNPGGFCGR